MLGVPTSKKSNRTLSVAQFTDTEKTRMNTSLQNLSFLVSQAKKNWKISPQDNTNPLNIALSLLDNTSVGIAYKRPNFIQLNDKLAESLQVAVNEHYQAFNNCIGSYDYICSSIDESQKSVKDVRQTLKKISADISSKNQVLNQLNDDSKVYGDMIEILNVVEDFKKIHDQIDNLFSEKKFRQIEEILSKSDLLAEKYQLWKIPALNKVKNYLTHARQLLLDTIIDELTATIYLKTRSSSLLFMLLNNDINTNFNRTDENVILQSSGGDNLKKRKNSSPKNELSANKDFSNLELYISNIINIDVFEKSSFIQSKLNEFLSNFDKKDDVASPISNFSDFDNEPYYYIQELLETLAKLNTLPKALQIISQRNSTELRKVVSETTEEIKITHPNVVQTLQKGSASNNENSLSVSGSSKTGKVNLGKVTEQIEADSKAEVKNILNFGLGIGDLNNIVLQDLFWQIFTKMLLVLQSHRVVFEISKKLTDLPEEQFASTTYNFYEIWKSISSEIRSLIYLYITDTDISYKDSSSSTVNKEMNSSEKSKTKFGDSELTPYQQITKANFDLDSLFLVANDKKPKIFSSTTFCSSSMIFQFDDDSFKDETGNLHSQELKNFLSEVFPGFKVNEKLEVMDNSSPYLTNEVSVTQETLVPPSVFNMRVILESFLVFVQYCRAVFPTSTAGSITSNEPSEFFHDFMNKTFLPQLDGTLIYLYNNSVNVNSLSLQNIPNFDLSGNLSVIVASNEQATANDIRVFKSSVDFHNLFSKVCEILNTSIKYREHYTGLSYKLLARFYEKYCNLYLSMLPNNGQHIVANANGNVVSETTMKKLNVWLSKSSDLMKVSLDIIKDDKNDKSKLNLETDLLLKDCSLLLRNIDRSEILFPKNFDTLTYLLVTLDWVLKWLPEMKNILKEGDPGGKIKDDFTNIEELRDSWELVEVNQTSLNNSKKYKISFTNGSPLLMQFEGAIENFDKLLCNTLLAIKFDIRLRLIYYIGTMIKNNIWNPNSNLNGICPEVKEMMAYIQFFNNENFTNMDSKIGEKIFSGIANVIDRLFIASAELIPVLNMNGVRKMYLNIITIQQSLRNILFLPEDVDFTHSLAYFDLFKKGPEKVLELVKLKKSLFSLQDNKTMVRLIFSQQLENRTDTASLEKYRDILRQLDHSK